MSGSSSCSICTKLYLGYTLGLILSPKAIYFILKSSNFGHNFYGGSATKRIVIKEPESPCGATICAFTVDVSKRELRAIAESVLPALSDVVQGVSTV